MRIPYTPFLLGLLALVVAACGAEPEPPSQPATEPGPLAQALQARAEASAAKAPDDVKAVLQDAAKTLEASGLQAAASRVGDQAPEFRLTDATGRIVSLSELRLEGPVVLAFYRGKW